MMNAKKTIESGNAILGVEFGSTRIKAVLIDERFQVLASGSFTWESTLINGYWSYPLDLVWSGLQATYAKLKLDVAEHYGITLQRLGAIGISGMMHGYLPFNSKGEALTEFRTWRNTKTALAALKLSALFDFNIPQRYSIAHLYQAILNGEKSVKDLAFLTTLAGYVHYRLTGQKVVGVGEASGMFPLDEKGQYNPLYLQRFEEAIANEGYPWHLQSILPDILPAGAPAGELTSEGARLLDPSGDLLPGVPFCPPEGDAGTGMVATNSLKEGTGNLSAGTSVFLMAVLQKPLQKPHQELDIVATPEGKGVAMVHANTCTSDLDAWMGLFQEVVSTLGFTLEPNELYTKLFNVALQGEEDAGGLVNYNCFAGEPVAGLEDGVPLFLRKPEGGLRLANFMRAQLYSSMAMMRLGMDILNEEGVKLTSVTAQGGLFKTPYVAQSLFASALDVPFSLNAISGEGGPWGMAILAAYRLHSQGISLGDYVADNVFSKAKVITVEPRETTRVGFAAFMRRYQKGLSLEKEAASIEKEKGE